MNQVWFQILAVLIFGSILKYFFFNKFVLIVIDMAVLMTSYLILKRHPFINLRQSMIFLGGLTLLNILVDIGALNAIASNVILLILVGWMIFRNGFSYSYPNRRRRK